ncbi:hypothetical protein CMO92_05010 [Candidatus Woesearchaeota archaeon]|nr:hypothetical protein [Candidatus Woesearchaeota archaeon]
MRVVLDLRKDVDENAASYFEKAKKARKKVEGALKALEMAREKKGVLEKKRAVLKKVVRKQEWFESFRWFVSSESVLVIGGRDAQSNETVIKKYAAKGDRVLHTDMAGSPFVVVKFSESKGGEKTIREAADFVACFSRGWKKGMASLDVFVVDSDQVTKKAKAGESMPTGAFMIYGDTKYVENSMNFGVGWWKDRVMGGPVRAVRKQCGKFVVEVIQGEAKQSDVGKAIKKRLEKKSGFVVDLDEVVRCLPVGVALKE